MFSRKKITGRTASGREMNHGQIQTMVAIFNRYSLIFHVLLACGVCFLIEWISRHSFFEACYFVVDRNLVFLYNSLIVFSSLMLVYIVKRRAVLRMMICVFWLFLGTINGCVLAKRVSPFSFTDLKMVGDLFTMQSNYFTASEAALVIAGVSVVVLFLVILWIKGPKFKGRQHRMMGFAMLGAVIMMLPNVTNAAVSNHVLTSYFENLAQGYKDYGFVYSFSASVLDRGMSQPKEYSEEAVSQVLQKQQGDSSAGESGTVRTSGGESRTEQGGGDFASARASAVSREGNAVLEKELNIRTTSGEIPENTDDTAFEYPNIICVLLESFVDPGLIKFLDTSEDPLPNFHYLYDNYSSGYVEVPVVGAGTANTEFEVLTGMGMQFFGLGEYPYKTILKKTSCESIASDLRALGYGSHVVHDNGGNFYSRKNAFSMMGFDTFTSKEMMDIHDYTPLGTWPQDDIMLEYVDKAMDLTPEQQDFVYVITVESHGDYPQEKVIENPEITVTGADDEGSNYAWEYYVNQIHQVDDFIGKLIAQLEERDEPTMVVMFGDHLPTMGLTDEDMETGSLFRTQYITWNNLDMKKQDKDLTSYQLLAEVTDRLGIHQGTMFTFHQNRRNYSSSQEYQKDMELLQYDILYGERYAYGGEDLYPATEIVMGVQDVVLDQIMETEKYYYFIGENFTRWSKVFVDGEKVSTSYISSSLLRCKKKVMEEGAHTLQVNQMGSSDTIFRSSNSLPYTVEEETEE